MGLRKQLRRYTDNVYPELLINLAIIVVIFLENIQPVQSAANSVTTKVSSLLVLVHFGVYFVLLLTFAIVIMLILLLSIRRLFKQKKGEMMRKVEYSKALLRVNVILIITELIVMTLKRTIAISNIGLWFGMLLYSVMISCEIIVIIILKAELRDD